MSDSNEIASFVDNDNPQHQKQQNKKIRVKRKRLRSKQQRQTWKVKLASYLIDDLKNHGPANIIHVSALSAMIKKPIRVWKSGGLLCHTINDRANESSTKNSIDIEYQHIEQLPNYIGHWTLLNNKDPINVELDLNGCLFAVIGIQIETRASDLRTDLIDFLTNNKECLIDEINKFLALSDNNGASLMIGSARYVGTSPNAASVILDASQNVYCYGCKERGHPRGHAIDPHATDPMGSVENYSRITQSMKSGFLSKTDQNNVAHLALSHPKAQRAMAELNDGALSQAITFSRQDFETIRRGLPKMKHYYNGIPLNGELPIYRLTLVLRHHPDKYKDPEADVFVHTFYPRSS